MNYSTVSNNTSTYGGAITTRGTMTLNGCTVSGNTSPFWGGGSIAIWASTGPTTINNSTISGNKTQNAGNGYGGGISVNGTLIVKNSTITGNTSVGGNGGGGIRLRGGSITLSNTIVAGNTDTSGTNAPDVGGAATANFCLISNTSGAAIVGANNLLNMPSGLDPVLKNNGELTQTNALLPGSAAIDAGNPAFVGPPNTD